MMPGVRLVGNGSGNDQVVTTDEPEEKPVGAQTDEQAVSVQDAVFGRGGGTIRPERETEGLSSEIHRRRARYGYMVVDAVEAQGVAVEQPSSFSD